MASLKQRVDELERKYTTVQNTIEVMNTLQQKQVTALEGLQKESKGCTTVLHKVWEQSKEQRRVFREFINEFRGDSVEEFPNSDDDEQEQDVPPDDDNDVVVADDGEPLPGGELRAEAAGTSAEANGNAGGMVEQRSASKEKKKNEEKKQNAKETKLKAAKEAKLKAAKEAKLKAAEETVKAAEEAVKPAEEKKQNAETEKLQAVGKKRDQTAAKKKVQDAGKATAQRPAEVVKQKGAGGGTAAPMAPQRKADAAAKKPAAKKRTPERPKKTDTNDKKEGEEVAKEVSKQRMGGAAGNAKAQKRKQLPNDQELEPTENPRKKPTGDIGKNVPLWTAEPCTDSVGVRAYPMSVKGTMLVTVRNKERIPFLHATGAEQFNAEKFNVGAGVAFDAAVQPDVMCKLAVSVARDTLNGVLRPLLGRQPLFTMGSVLRSNEAVKYKTVYDYLQAQPEPTKSIALFTMEMTRPYAQPALEVRWHMAKGVVDMCADVFRDLLQGEPPFEPETA